MRWFELLALLLPICILSMPIYAALARVFWGDRYETFGETLKYLLCPDLISLFRGRFWQDWEATLKFNAWLLLCIGWTAAIAVILAPWLL